MDKVKEIPVRSNLPPLMKLEVFVMDWKEGQVQFKTTNRSAVVNLNHIVKMLPASETHYSLYMVGDTHQDVIYVSSKEFEQKMEDA